jgi:hypothetical protein
MAGGPDLEFARPYVDSEIWEPYIPAVSQAAEYEVNSCVELGKIPGLNIRAAEVSIGEKLESLRQLVRLYRPTINSAAYLYVLNGFNTYMPFLRLVVGQNGTNAAPLQNPTFVCDQIDLFSAMYTFETGSIRVQVTPGNPSTPALIGFGLSDTPTPARILTSIALPAYTLVRYIRSFINTASEAYIDVNVPPYQRTVGRATAGQLYSDNGAYTLAPAGADPVTTSLNFQVMNSSDTVARQFYLSRQVGDDWNCYGFISTVPMVNRTIST